MRVTKLISIIILVIILVPDRWSWPADPPKRILLLNSFGRNVAPFSIVTSVFRTQLSLQSPQPIDLHEVSLDMACFTQPGQEVPFVNFLQARFSAHHPDLVVSVGGPAFLFLDRHREALFPETPVLITAVFDQVLGTRGIPGNAAVVPMRVDLRGLMEEILRVLPALRNLAVVLGASPLENFWIDECRREFAPFADRVDFIYLNQLSFEEIRRRIANLPSNSAIFFGLLLIDKTGITFDPGEAIKVIIEEANAPVFALFESFLGNGIVGSPSLQERAAGWHAAQIALRILKGEPASNFQFASATGSKSVYDWRALQRWNISENRLPRQSKVLFRQPSIWDLYRWYIVGAVAFIISQSFLIARLMVQIRRLRLAKRDLAQNEEKLHLEKQESRRLYDELLHANRVTGMGELAGALAHEINQPLSAIMSNAQAARRYLSAPSPDLDEVREILPDIADEAGRAGEIINRLRALLKRTTTVFEPIDLNLLISEVVSLLHSDTVIRKVKVRTALDPRVALVQGDRIQLQQVVLNLMANAFDAMDNGNGEAGSVLIQTCLKDGTVLTSIKDSGQGIPVDKTEKVFNPYHTSKPQGLGMGLSISRSIVARHRGRIWVENNIGVGATFHFTLPIEQGEQDPAIDEKGDRTA